jgi:hypothetical protein
MNCPHCGKDIQMKKFRLHWLTGGKETIEGHDIADAFRRAGYGGGALNALDYYEEIKRD